LHSAVNCADIKLVQKLLEYDADINAVNEYGSTPLQWASRGLYLEEDATLRLLLKHGADVNARDEDGSTPLHEASKYGALEVARLLLEYGADVEAKDNSGRTASEVGSGYDEFVKFLRERVAE
jgi:ankyrin repeat protein